MSYAFKSAPISIGTVFTWSYQQAKEFSGTIHTFSQSEYFWELNFFVNWTISREQALGLSYSDSTLIGKNINSPLYRNVALTFTKSIPL
jgi:hypothetical protein